VKQPCPIGKLPCGPKTCLNPETEICLKYKFNSTEYGETEREAQLICPRGNQVCGGICYDPQDTGNKCVGEVLCSVEEEICDSQCYNPNEQQCLNSQTVCKPGEKLCEGACYNPESEKCLVVTQSESEDVVRD